VELAARICEAPMALITFVDERRQWFKARVGVHLQETPRELAFCAHAIAQPGEIMVVPDATQDPRFADNPFVTEAEGVRFYAGAPLVTASGEAVGALCVLDRVPRALRSDQLQALEIFSRKIMTHLRLRHHLREQAKLQEELRQSEREQRQRNAVLRMVGRVARIGGWTLETPGPWVTWSDEIYDILEFPRDQPPRLVAGLAHFPRPDRLQLVRAIAACRRHGRPYELELRMRSAHGREIWVQISGEAVRRPDGGIAQVQGTLQDITARKAAEERADVLANRLMMTFENLTDGFLLLDRRWRIIYVNAEAARMAQHARPAMVGRAVWKLFPATVATLAQRECERALRENVPVEFEYYYQPMDVWFEVRAYPSPLGLALSSRDITPRKQAAEALRAGEERFRLLAKATRDAIWDWDLINDTIWWSEGFTELFGYQRYEIEPTSVSWTSRVHPEDQLVVVEDVHHAINHSAERWSCEYRFRRKDGRYAHVLDRGHIIRDGAGKAVRMIGGMADITERHEAAERLRVSEEQYRLLFAGNPYPMWVFDTENLRYLAVNDAMVRHFGYSHEEFMNMSVFTGDDPAAIEKLKGHLATEGRYVGTRCYHKKDGTDVDVEIHSDRIVFGGRPARLSLAQDVTERVRAERQLREQAELLDKAQDAIIVRDLEHRIRYCNKSAEQLYGFQRAEVLGRSVREVFYFEPGTYDAAMNKLMASGEWVGELVQRCQDEKKIIVEAHWTLVRNEAGQATSVLAINTDITERKKLEQQFLRAQRIESIGTLAGGIAHDLNNLLAPITMGVELLRRFDPPQKSLRVIDSIERSARRGSDLVKQVLSFARGVEGSRVIVHLKHVVREIESIMENTFPKNIQIKAELPAELPPVLGDPTQLNQVLLNLCVNARDAMPEGGRLTIVGSSLMLDEHYAVMHRGVAAGRYVCLEVQDSGCGMSPEVQQRIFDPFFTTKEIGKGTGLGLPTAMGIIRSHGGFINVYSEPGKGSTFRMHLPAEAMAGDVVANPVAAELPRGHGETILIVDDESTILSITQQTLETFGYRAIVAVDGAQAIGLYAVHREEIAVVLTDMMMPVMDGTALAAALLRLNPKVKIIAASGLNANANVAKAMAAGVKQFLGKPYTAEALLQLIDKVVQEPA